MSNLSTLDRVRAEIIPAMIGSILSRHRGPAEGWSVMARRIVAATIEQHRGCDERTMRKHLRDAWPWGERVCWPYKAWCRAVRDALDREYRPEPPEGQPR